MTEPEETQLHTPLPVKPGDVLLGKYKIERILGAGGMGAVVAARHLQLDQLVAIKFLYTYAQQHAESLARFQREARAAVRLRSDHVARVIDVGELESGAPFIVMEHLEGADLADVVQHGGPLGVPAAVDYVLQACDAIAEAHALGIIHRDLKPKNLFLTTSSKGHPLVKVLDFGISKVTGQDELSLTRTTTVVGSPNYMSPEQLRASRDVDQRADIWSLGAILYELLTGHVPFPAETVTQLTAMVVADPFVPIETYRTDLPDGLKAVIARCLEKKRDDRFGSVAELAAALAPWATQPSLATVSGSFRPPPASAPLGVSSSGQLPVLQQSDRPSIRVPGETSSAWGDTQLVQPARSRAPMILGALGVAILIGAGAVFATLHFKGGATPSQPVASTIATPAVSETLAAPSASAAPSAAEAPTTRDLGRPNPLVSPTGGPVRPIPALGAKPDAGKISPSAPAASSGGSLDDLPTIRH